MNTKVKGDGGEGDDVNLSDKDKAMAASLGLTEEEYSEGNK